MSKKTVFSLVSFVLLLSVGSTSAMQLHVSGDWRVDKENDTIVIRQEETQKASYKHESADMACISATGSFAATASSKDGSVKMVKLKNGKRKSYTHKAGITCIGFKKANNSCLFASVSESNGQVIVHRLADKMARSIFEICIKSDPEYAKQRRLLREVSPSFGKQGNISKKEQSIDISLCTNGTKDYITIVRETTGKGSFDFYVYDLQDQQAKVVASQVAKPLRTIVKDNYLLSHLNNGAIYIYDLGKSECIKKINCSGIVTDFIMDAKKEKLIVECRTEKGLSIIGYYKEKCVFAYVYKTLIQKKAFIQDRYLVMFLKNGNRCSVEIHDMCSGKELFNIPLNISSFSDIDQLFVTKKQNGLVVQLRNGDIFCFDRTNKVILRKKSHDLRFGSQDRIQNSLVLDGYVVLINLSGMVTIFDAHQERLFQQNIEFVNNIVGCSVSLFSKETGMVKVITLSFSNSDVQKFYIDETGEAIKSYNKETVRLTGSPECHHLANDTIKLFDRGSKKELISVESSSRPISVYIDKKEQRYVLFCFFYAYTCGCSYNFQIFDLNTGKKIIDEDTGGHEAKYLTINEDKATLTVFLEDSANRGSTTLSSQTFELDGCFDEKLDDDSDSSDEDEDDDENDEGRDDEKNKNISGKKRKRDEDDMSFKKKFDGGQPDRKKLKRDY